MLNHISWTNYLVFIVIILIGYYAIVFFKYYKVEIRDILLGRHSIFQRIRQSNKSTIEIQEKKGWNNEQSDEHDLFPEVTQFKNEIKHTLKEAAENNVIKQEVIFSLQRLAKKYSQIKVSPYQTSINNYILSESSDYGSVQLSESDVCEIWAI